MINFHHFNKRVLILGLLFLFINAVNGQIKKTGSPFFFIQISDPQFGMSDNNQGYDKETLLMEKAVMGINKSHPDFVVITGDFVHDQKSESQVQEFKRIVAKINPGIPVYYIPGNHDVGQNPDIESLKEYEDKYGNDRFSFTHKGSAFIGINTSLIKARVQPQEQKQFKWLANKLKKFKNANHIILFGHYPFYNSTPGEAESYSNLNPEDRKRYLSLFEHYGVDAVFSGHLHNNNEKMQGSILLVTTSALGKPLGSAPSGLRIVKVFDNRLEHFYYDVDEFPDFVNFE